MKQFFALAGLFAVLSVSAQQQPNRKLIDPKDQKEMRQNHKFDRKDFKDRKDFQKGKRQRPSIDDQVKSFDKYSLSQSQKQKVKSLYEARDKEMKKEIEQRKKEFAKLKEQRVKKHQEFDQKIEKILDKQQYAKYKADREIKYGKRGDLKIRTHHRPSKKG